MASFTLGGKNLDFDTLAQVFGSRQPLELPAEAGLVAAQAELAAGTPELSRAYLEAQVLTFGPETEEKIIRLALLLLLHTRLQPSGAEATPTATLQRLLAFYNREVYPIVLRYGADATRLAQLCQPLLLSGKVRFQGFPLKAAEVAEMFSWQALPLTSGQVQALLAAPVFSWAQTADVLMHLKPLTNWFIYFDAVFGQVLPDSNAALHQSLRDQIRIQAEVQQALEQQINSQGQRVALEQALERLAQVLPQTLRWLADLQQVLLEGLETMVEPPATATFAWAADMARRLRVQASHPALASQSGQDASLTLESLAQQLTYAHTLAGLVFWSFIQADVLSGDFLESSTLQTYQQAGLFVAEETANEQLEKISDFIQTHIPVGAT